MAYLAIFLSYLVGSIPSGLVLAKAFGLQDPRTFASGNIGASNLVRVGGLKIGILTLICDFSKGFIPVFLVQMYFRDNIWISISVGFATIFGHCYSVFLKFDGGKGVATSAGVLFLLAPLAAVFGLVAWIICFLVERITSLSALVASLVIPTIIALQGEPSPLLILSCAITLLIFRRHNENIKALMNNSERSFKRQ